jgi:DNA-binding NarL/FixJ family response regulator
MIDVLLVHHQKEYTEQLKAVLHGEPDMRVVHCVSTVDEALQWSSKNHCAIVLVSYTLPDMQALELVRVICAEGLGPKVLVTDMQRDPETVLYWMEEGAAGYVYADEGWAGLVKKLRAVEADEFLLCPDIAAALIARIAELKQLAHELDAGHLAQPTVTCAELTPREREVLRLIGREMSNQEIAETLVIELGTVKNHVHNLLRKLDVCNRKQAAQVARQILGEVEVEDLVAAY